MIFSMMKLEAQYFSMGSDFRNLSSPQVPVLVHNTINKEVLYNLPDREGEQLHLQNELEVRFVCVL